MQSSGRPGAVEPPLPEPQRFSGVARDSGEPSTSERPAGAGAAGAALVPAARRTPVRRIVGQQVPDEILKNAALNAAIAILPANYNFEARTILHGCPMAALSYNFNVEVHKTVWRLRQARARRVALQMPEGLQMYACVLADILESFAGVEAVVMGDVAYGACCVDDYSAAALGADFLVHYGHSCLVPVDVTPIPCMYVFVDIKMDVEHFIATVRHNFPAGSRLVLAGTIQFASSIQAARQALAADYPSLTIPQARPLSPGEVLGCTAPRIPPPPPLAGGGGGGGGGWDALLFVADGRFHLEALMIANPDLPAYRYDPYGRALTKEGYDQEGMRAARRAAIEAARGAEGCWGLVLGTLGRQGNLGTLARLRALLDAAGRPHIMVLLSEVTPAKLAALGEGGIDAWVQVACPRLSIDWGEGFTRPTLNPYEAYVALGAAPGWWEPGAGGYAMDYYASQGGAWNGTYHRAQPRAGARPSPAAVAAAARAAAGVAGAAAAAGPGGSAAVAVDGT